MKNSVRSSRTTSPAPRTGALSGFGLWPAGDELAIRFINGDGNDSTARRRSARLPCRRLGTRRTAIVGTSPASRTRIGRLGQTPAMSISC